MGDTKVAAWKIENTPVEASPIKASSKWALEEI
jgi:hypothetical protein